MTVADSPNLPPWYGQVDCQTEDALLAASRAYLEARLPPPEWLRPLPPLEPYLPEHSAVCDLGEYLEHYDGRLEALPADHALGHTVAYALPAVSFPGREVDPWGIGPAPGPVVTLPVRRVAVGYLRGMVQAPQPAPRYSYLERGRQIRTGAPS